MRDWTKILIGTGSLFIFPGGSHSHPILPSGLHIDSYFNRGALMNDPQLLNDTADNLVEVIYLHLNQSPDVVVSLASHTVRLAQVIAWKLNTKDTYLEWRGEKIILNNFSLFSGTSILLVNDILTFSGLSEIPPIIQSLKDSKAKILPFFLVVCNFSGQKEIGEMKIISLMERQSLVWKNGGSCALCQAGSPAMELEKHWTTFFPKQ